MSRYRAVFFDLHETLGTHDPIACPPLVDDLLRMGLSHDDATHSVAIAMSHVYDGEMHIEASYSAESYDNWRRSETRQFLQSLCDHARAPKHFDIGGAMNTIFDRINALDNSMVLYPGVDDTLRVLREHDITTAVCSNWAWHIETAIDTMGLTALVDFVFCSAQIGARKPSRYFFDHILAHVGIDADNVLFVGDNWNADIVGAKNAGLSACFVSATAPRSLDGDSSVMTLKTVNELPNVLL